MHPQLTALMSKRVTALVVIALAAAATASATADGTPDLTLGVAQVQHEAAYTQYTLAKHGLNEPVGYLVSLGAMNYVVGHVTAPAYGYAHELNGGTGMPDPTAESSLETQAGICGHAALTFAAIVQQFGYPVRSVQFYYPGGNHIADEVFYAGTWHFFDPTWGVLFRRNGVVLSITQARATGNPSSYMVSDKSLLWANAVNEANMQDDTGMRASVNPESTVVLGAQPF